MTETDDPEKYRSQLASYARRKECRELGWPRDWNPGAITRPGSYLPLTESGAWELIAELLDGDHPIETLLLDDPKGKLGFIMKVVIDDTGIPLYIKIHFGSKGVVGRSFHKSHY